MREVKRIYLTADKCDDANHIKGRIIIEGKGTVLCIDDIMRHSKQDDANCVK